MDNDNDRANFEKLLRKWRKDRDAYNRRIGPASSPHAREFWAMFEAGAEADTLFQFWQDYRGGLNELLPNIGTDWQGHTI